MEIGAAALSEPSSNLGGITGSTDKAYMPELVERIQYSTGLIYFNAEVQILL